MGGRAEGGQGDGRLAYALGTAPCSVRCIGGLEIVIPNLLGLLVFVNRRLIHDNSGAFGACLSGTVNALLQAAIPK